MPNQPLRIPQAGVSMTEATLVEWLVADGSTITSGEPIYRIQTEKVELDVEAPYTGTLRQSGEAGSVYEVGDQIGEVETE